ncbi:hypothetical protein MRB53_039308 [Persea americana]|nr:hypothetical protein MRB53_039308 [Persea americana]
MVAETTARTGHSAPLVAANIAMPQHKVDPSMAETHPAFRPAAFLPAGIATRFLSHGSKAGDPSTPARPGATAAAGETQTLGQGQDPAFQRISGRKLPSQFSPGAVGPTRTYTPTPGQQPLYAPSNLNPAPTQHQHQTAAYPSGVPSSFYPSGVPFHRPRNLRSGLERILEFGNGHEPGRTGSLLGPAAGVAITTSGHVASHSFSSARTPLTAAPGGFDGRPLRDVRSDGRTPWPYDSRGAGVAAGSLAGAGRSHSGRHRHRHRRDPGAIRPADRRPRSRSAAESRAHARFAEQRRSAFVPCRADRRACAGACRRRRRREESACQRAGRARVLRGGAGFGRRLSDVSPEAKLAAGKAAL